MCLGYWCPRYIESFKQTAHFFGFLIDRFMIACIDVGYNDASARAACVTLRGWSDEMVDHEFVVDVAPIAEYVPGQFFRRELPCLLAALEELPEKPSAVIVDGYVDLSPIGAPGLGRHLYNALCEASQVIGVAKNTYHEATHALEIFRGNSSRPLFVTAAGIPAAQAAKLIQEMHGPNRIPTILQRVDQLSRTRPS